MKWLFETLNSIDDSKSLLENRGFAPDDTLPYEKKLNESYVVKYDRTGTGVSFETLDKAITHINQGMKNHSSEHFILYNDDKEMIWIDRYKDENDNDVGYTASRQNDKSLSLKDNVLTAKVEVQDDAELRGIVVKEAGRMGYLRDAQKFAKMRLVVDKSEPSHIDFSENVIYYNTDQQLNDAIETLVKQLHSKTEALKSRLNEDDEKDAEGDQSEVDNTKEKDDKKDMNSIIDQLRKIDNYHQFVEALKHLNDKQKALFMKEFGNVEAIHPNTQSGGIAVTQLLPTQSEIDWKKSLSYGLGQDCSYFFKEPVELGMPVLTFNSKYIIDGHHRWSQVFMFNPSGKVSCIDFKYDQSTPSDVLKDFQAAILATTGTVPEGTAGTNIWSVSKDELVKFITENIQDACWQSLVKANVATDKQSAINYIVKNALTLQQKVKPAPGSPDRVDMPQTNKQVIAAASKAMSDMSESRK